MIKVEQKFIGSVFGRKTHLVALFDTMGILYQSMLSHEDSIFGRDDKPSIEFDKFMPDLMDAILYFWESNSVGLADITDELRDYIDACENIKALQFSVYGDQGGFETLNQNIKDGKYLLPQT